MPFTHKHMHTATKCKQTPKTSRRRRRRSIFLQVNESTTSQRIEFYSCGASIHLSTSDPSDAHTHRERERLEDSIFLYDDYTHGSGSINVMTRKEREC